MATAAPADFQSYKRRDMADETSGGNDPAATNREKYILQKEFHRTLRQALTGAEYKVFCALEDWSESKGECWHSQSTIADACDLSLRSVNGAIGRLETLGLVESKERAGQSSTYIPARATYAKIAYLRDNLRKICVGGYAKSAQPPTQNLRTNVSNPNGSKENANGLISDEINGTVVPLPDEPAKTFISQNQPGKEIQPGKPDNPVAGEAKVPPLYKQGPLFHRLKTAYLAAGGEPSGHNKRCGVIGEAWEEVTGKPPDYKFISKVMREDAGGIGWDVIKAILGMANKDITEPPEGYLRKVLKNGKQQQQQQGRPGLAGDSGQKQLVERHSAAARPTPKSIKPTGSGPGGRFTTDEYLEDY